jgi:hypothetical protein
MGFELGKSGTHVTTRPRLADRGNRALFKSPHPTSAPEDACLDLKSCSRHHPDTRPPVSGCSTGQWFPPPGASIIDMSSPACRLRGTLQLHVHRKSALSLRGKPIGRARPTPASTPFLHDKPVDLHAK